MGTKTTTINKKAIWIFVVFLTTMTTILFFKWAVRENTMWSGAMLVLFAGVLFWTYCKFLYAFDCDIDVGVK